MENKPKFFWKYNIKSSVFSKSTPYFIALYNDFFTATCCQIQNDTSGKTIEKIGEVKFDYTEIKNISEQKYQNKDYIRIDTDFHSAKNSYFLIPVNSSQYDAEDFKSKLSILSNDCITRKKNFEKACIEIQEKKSIQMRLKEFEEKQFFQNTYNFHIHENTPKYIFEQSENYISMLYLNEHKDLNFLTIDGYLRKEVNGILSYENIHYYERAGTIHYVSDVDINYQGKSSFGGSFKSSNVSIGSAMLGGLLFGPMGMAVGAMASYKPMEYKPPEYTPESLNVKSTIQRIDERSVILNYYSQEHKQFMDVEFPQDTFNFFQTFLPQKKYDVVIELEKVQAKQSQTVSNNNSTNIKISLDTESIKQRLKNLKELYDEELITEDEFFNRKKEILSEI